MGFTHDELKVGLQYGHRYCIAQEGEWQNKAKWILTKRHYKTCFSSSINKWQPSWVLYKPSLSCSERCPRDSPHDREVAEHWHCLERYQETGQIRQASAALHWQRLNPLFNSARFHMNTPLHRWMYSTYIHECGYCHFEYMYFTYTQIHTHICSMQNMKWMLNLLWSSARNSPIGIHATVDMESIADIPNCNKSTMLTQVNEAWLVWRAPLD